MTTSAYTATVREFPPRSRTLPRHITGALGFLQLLNNGGSAAIDVSEGGNHESMSIAGGAVDARVYNGRFDIRTPNGPTGSVLRMGAGDATIASLGPDTIYAGSGDETIVVSAAAQIYAGTGTLRLFGHGTSGATLYGNGGDYEINGDGGAITYIGGALDSTVEAILSNNRFTGGAGHLTINGGARETVAGGSGGLTLNETATGGGDLVTTAVGSTNILALYGSNTVQSWGYDTITAGPGSETIAVYGDATIAAAGNASVAEAGATLHFTNTLAAASVTVTGGVASLVSYAQSGATGGISVTTAQGASTDVAMGDGRVAVTAAGNDTIEAGASPASITTIGGNAQITGAAGALAVHNHDTKPGDHVTLAGGAGTVSYDQSAGSLTFLGGSGDTVIAGGTGSLDLTAGTGSLTVSGGAASLKIVAGSGYMSVALPSTGGQIEFGSGIAAVHEAGWGSANIFAFVAGQSGGTDTITGFRAGVDILSLQGVAVVAQQIVSGTATLTLTDGTALTLTNVGSNAQLFA